MEGILIIAGLAIYFLPTLLANNNSHKNFTGVFLLNLFAGWTFIGWVGALIWAVAK